MHNRKATKYVGKKGTTTCRKHKESALKSLTDHLISQLSLYISPIWVPVITAEVRRKKKKNPTTPSTVD
jgi:hypothetical protein